MDRPLHRYQLFSTFLIVPAGFLRVLASKQVHVDEDDINDSDSDDGDAQGNQEGNVFKKVSLGIDCSNTWWIGGHDKGTGDGGWLLC
jgi:hypothetical protein